jgi:hypothetical protein
MIFQHEIELPGGSVQYTRVKKGAHRPKHNDQEPCNRGIKEIAQLIFCYFDDQSHE